MVHANLSQIFGIIDHDEWVVTGHRILRNTVDSINLEEVWK